MTERPILFSAPMVRAVLDDSKTQTRRIVKPQLPFCQPHPGGGWMFTDANLTSEDVARYAIGAHGILCPYGQPGDRLWVRETWALLRGADSKEAYRGIPESKPTENNTMLGMVPVPIYAADGRRSDVVEPHFETHRPMRWKPSIHMPRWASRITLEVLGVRVERLQDISEEDILAEGVRISVNEAGRPCIRVTGKHPPVHFLRAAAADVPAPAVKAYLAGRPTRHADQITRYFLSPDCPRPVHEPPPVGKSRRERP